MASPTSDLSALRVHHRAHRGLAPQVFARARDTEHGDRARTGSSTAGLFLRRENELPIMTDEGLPLWSVSCRSARAHSLIVSKHDRLLMQAIQAVTIQFDPE